MKRGGKALVYQYVWCRWIDDVVDCDFPDIVGLDIVGYAQKRFYFIESLASWRGIPETAEDRLIMEAWRIATESWKEKEIQESFRMIVESMVFDAQRIQMFKKTRQYEFPSESSLREHFYNLDIIWTWTGMLVYLGSQDILWDLKKVESIWKAVRIEYDLHDFVEDLSNGIVNITDEDAKKYNISVWDLEKVIQLKTIKKVDPSDPAKILYQDIREYPLSIQRWIQDQIELYHAYIDDFTQNSYPHFPFLTRQVFQNYYLSPTKKGISQITTLLYA